MLNLDTHILLFALTGQLTDAEQALLESDPWGISDIVIWEIAKLAQRGRIQMELDDSELIRLLAGITVWPITLDICRAITTLDFRSDPADEIIAATSLVQKAPLVTRDRKIKTSKVVPMALR